MNWTKEIPTVGGWYWVMCSYTKVKFIEFIQDGSYWDDAIGDSFPFTYEQGYEFYGPLEEPK